MRQIIKSKEPKSLASYRKKRGAKFGNDDMPKDELRASLIKDQGYICCYCMKRITLQDDATTNTKIEHFKPQSIYNGTDGKPDLTLNYSNLFLACKGEEVDDNDKKCNCCDSKKLHKELVFVDIQDKSIEDKLRYTPNGFIYSDPKYIDCDPQIFTNTDNINGTEEWCLDADLNVTLNLNNQSLKKERKNVYDAVLQVIHSVVKKQKNVLPSLNRLRRKWYEKYEEDGRMMFKPFCMVAVYLIDKYIKKQEAKQSHS